MLLLLIMIYQQSWSRFLITILMGSNISLSFFYCGHEPWLHRPVCICTDQQTIYHVYISATWFTSAFCLDSVLSVPLTSKFTVHTMEMNGVSICTTWKSPWIRSDAICITGWTCFTGLSLELLPKFNQSNLIYVFIFINDFYVIYSKTWWSPYRTHFTDFIDSCRLITGWWGRTFAGSRDVSGRFQPTFEFLTSSHQLIKLRDSENACTPEAQGWCLFIYRVNIK